MDTKKERVGEKKPGRPDGVLTLGNGRTDLGVASLLGQNPTRLTVTGLSRKTRTGPKCLGNW